MRGRGLEDKEGYRAVWEGSEGVDEAEKQE